MRPFPRFLDVSANKDSCRKEILSEADEKDRAIASQDRTAATCVSSYVEYARRRFNLPEKVDIFDTTLRDGEGTPGVNFTLKEKFEIVKTLDDLGVAVIEAGAPSPLR